MRVAFDLNPVIRNRFSGFWTHGCQLLGALAGLDEVESIVAFFTRKIGLAADEFPLWRHPKFRPVPARIRVRRWERWWGLSRWPSLQRMCGEFDVYHSFHHLMPPTRGRPRVLTVHDLRRFRLPELYPRSRVDHLERAVAAADRIIAISRSARSDLIELLGVDGSRVDVIHLGTPSGFAPPSAGERREVLDALWGRFGRRVGGFAATVGSADRRKNIPAAIGAFARAANRLPADFCLLILGNVPQSDELTAAVARSGVADRLLFAGPLDPEEYRSFLAASRMFLYLSRYEGFGLPLLEAMASGVPVIAANLSSLPEVVGDAGVLVDPLDQQGISDHVLALAQDDALWRRHRQLALERAGQFTWRRAAEKTLACYRRAMEQTS